MCPKEVIVYLQKYIKLKNVYNYIYVFIVCFILVFHFYSNFYDYFPFSVSKEALLTNIFLDTSQNEITNLESQHFHIVTNCISKLQKKNLQTKLKGLNVCSQIS